MVTIYNLSLTVRQGIGFSLVTAALSEASDDGEPGSLIEAWSRTISSPDPDLCPLEECWLAVREFASQESFSRRVGIDWEIH